MGPAYLHGSEMQNVENGILPIQSVRSSVIGIVGIAPKGPRQQLIQILNDTDKSQFGAELPGFTIPQALAAIFDQQACQVLVVNVYDPTTHNAAVTAESMTLVNGKARTAFPPLSAITFSSGALTIGTQPVLGADYTINDYGDIVSLNPTVLPNGQSFNLAYAKLDVTTVSSANIIGANTSGVRTGGKLFDLAYGMFGFKAKVIIAPGFSQLAAVAAELRIISDKFKGVDLVDAPVGTSYANALAGRGPSGSIPFNTSGKRSILCYPHVKRYSAYASTAPGVTTDQYVNMPYSAFLAGVIAKTDINDGYHYSPSNHTINGIVGLERDLTFDPTDNTGTTEVNQLNAAGIVTIGNTYGTGFLVWGNHNAAFPTSANLDSFIPCQRTRDVLEDSLQLGFVPFLDKPIGNPQIASVVESGNEFIRTLVGRGALIEGTAVSFNPDDNTPTLLAQGKVTFRMNHCEPPPIDRLTVLSTIDISLLKAIRVQ